MTDVILIQVPYTRDGPERFSLNFTTASGFAAETVNDVNLPQAWESMTEFTVDLPYSGSCSFTYAVIENKGFWIQDYAFVSNRLNTVRWQLIRDPWPDYIGKKITGVWDALPTRTSPYLKDVIANTELVVTKDGQYALSASIPRIGTLPGMPSEKAFWVSVSLKRSLSINKKGLFQYGMLVTSNQSRNIRTPRANAQGTLQNNYKYPSLSECINNLDIIMNNIATANSAGSVTADDIVDVSISERCPFDYSITVTQGVYYASVNGLPDLIDYVHDTEYGLFIVESSYAPVKRTERLVIPQITAVFGQVHIRDINSNTVAVLNSDHLNYFMEITTISDISGTYTEIAIKKDDANGKIIQIVRLQEGHLPFLGNAWNTYNAYERAYDRESMQLNINSANANAILNAGTSVVSGAVTGALVGNIPGAAIGGVSSLIGMGSNLYANRMEREKLEAMQDLKEEQYRIMSSTSNNVAYGLFYARADHSADIVAMLPEGLDSTMVNNYLRIHGYPAVGRKDVTLNQTGFYRGRMEQLQESPSALNNKRLIDLMNSELSRGVHLLYIQ